MLKKEVLKQMSDLTGINVQDEGIPSKAIWDPSLSFSSSSSVASTSSDRSNDEVLADADPASGGSSTSGAATGTAPPFAEATEAEMRMRIYEDESENAQNDDDNRMSSMLASSISRTHGASSGKTSSREARIKRDEEKNNQLFGGPEPDGRHRFVNSLSHLSDKQLRVQLWDSFRLARVILGAPVKDKRRLSHKSILHAIRKVAEMRIQIIRMSVELDGYHQREKKRKRLKRKSKSPGKENVAGQPEMEEEDFQSPQKQEDSSSIFSSSMNDAESVPGSLPSIRDVVSDSDSPNTATAKLREEAIKILQEESDLALSQIQEINERQRKRPRFSEQAQLLTSPAHSTGSGPHLFLSPSDSFDDDDVPYTNPESASDMLYSFGGKRSPMRQKEQSTTMGANPVILHNDVNEIRRVLQRVIEFENNRKNPEVTTEDINSSSQVHEEVISLLSRLVENSPTSMMPSNEAKAEAQQSILGVEKKENEEFFDEEPASDVLPSKESEADVAMDLVVAEEENSREGDDKKRPFDESPFKVAAVKTQKPPVVVDEEEDEEVAKCRAQLSAAKMQEAKSLEVLHDLGLQKELLEGDIAIARENTTKNREQVHLECLKGYKKELKALAKREEERAKQINDLDSSLDQLATVCVKLEDRESNFRKKHERHRATLDEFRTITKNHTESFLSLLGSIDRGIKEQTATVFGDEKTRDDDLKSLPSDESGEASIDADVVASQKIQRMEYLLTKQNMELFRLKAQLKVNEMNAKQAKNLPSRINY